MAVRLWMDLDSIAHDTASPLAQESLNHIWLNPPIQKTPKRRNKKEAAPEAVHHPFAPNTALERTLDRFQVGHLD